VHECFAVFPHLVLSVIQEFPNIAVRMGIPRTSEVLFLPGLIQLLTWGSHIYLSTLIYMK